MEVRFKSKFPTLSTERLIMRELTSQDAEFIHFMRSDPTVNQFMKRSQSHSIKDAQFFIDQRHQDYFNKKAVYWGICLKTNGFLIGCITLWNLDLEMGSAEVGYELHPGFTNRGFMSEAMDEVISFGCNMLQLKEIVAITGPNNKRSIHLLGKKGFTLLSNDKLSEIDQEAGLVGYRFVTATQ